jgi:glucose/arabinose dehydrogenase
MPNVSKLAAALVLTLSSTAGGRNPVTVPPRGPVLAPFSVFPTAIFKSPWAMAFLPGAGRDASNMALVTEREGRLWLVDVAKGASQQVAGAPEVKVFEQGGLGDVVTHPDYARNQRVYLSYAEPGPNGTAGRGSGIWPPGSQ